MLLTLDDRAARGLAERRATSEIESLAHVLAQAPRSDRAGGARGEVAASRWAATWKPWRAQSRCCRSSGRSSSAWAVATGAPARGGWCRSGSAPTGAMMRLISDVVRICDQAVTQFSRAGGLAEQTACCKWPPSVRT